MIGRRLLLLAFLATAFVALVAHAAPDDDSVVCPEGQTPDIYGDCCAESDRGCEQVCGTSGVFDACGDCNGGNARRDKKGNCCDSSERGCDDICGGDVSAKDACGVCHGDDACCGDGGRCSNHGVCAAEHGGCKCDAGWTGAACEHQISECADDPCDHGFCDQVGGRRHCVCDAGWHGMTCSMRECGRNEEYIYTTDECHCIHPYIKTGDGDDGCYECTPLEAGTKRLCVHVPAGIVSVVLPRKFAARAVVQGYMGFNVTLAGTDGFDCGCTPDGEVARNSAPAHAMLEAVTRAVPDECVSHRNVPIIVMCIYIFGLSSLLFFFVPFCSCWLAGTDIQKLKGA